MVPRGGKKDAKISKQTMHKRIKQAKDNPELKACLEQALCANLNNGQEPGYQHPNRNLLPT
eukprot:715040-Amphidinium_carterae.1